LLDHQGTAERAQGDVIALVLGETPVGACTRDPERWTAQPDEGAKAICRACPRRWTCARDACETPGAEGIWAGILIPEGGRARRFALTQLRSLAELNGFPVRTMGRARPDTGDSIAS
jgi:WhiB family redox-sensing transcriptional regulator